MSNFSFVTQLRCPNCHSRLTILNNTCFCISCENDYDSPEGIPLLVRDQQTHLFDLNAARNVNPLWYEQEQPPETTSPWRHHLRRRRLYVTSVLQREMVNRGIDTSCRMLDLGCGDGNNMTWLNEFSNNLYGSDYNLTRLARARKLMPEAHIFLANILDYPVEDNFFDVIFFNHVIEHIQDDVTALREVHRILKPGGLLVLGAPNEGCWWWQHAYKRDPESLRTTDHVHFYTDKTLSQRMQKAGLQITEVKSMGFGLPDWRLDGKIRQYKWADDVFEAIGSLLMPSQASSLYIISTKS